MKTFFRSVAMLLGLGLLPVAAHAQKKVIIEDEEPNPVRIFLVGRSVQSVEPSVRGNAGGVFRSLSG